MPYFQPPTRNPPSRFDNYGGGMPTKGNGSLFHGNGRPLGGGSEPSKRGGGPPSGGKSLSGNNPPSG
jgi:hypothetical protein